MSTAAASDFEMRCAHVRGITDRTIVELMSVAEMDNGTALRLLCIQSVIRMEPADVAEMSRFIFNEVSDRSGDDEDDD